MEACGTNRPKPVPWGAGFFVGQGDKETRRQGDKETIDMALLKKIVTHRDRMALLCFFHADCADSGREHASVRTKNRHTVKNAWPGGKRS
jgi:hypothetical protein